ncbi:4960_t:CDS:2 [Paraglomus brasilianum]|uniref:Kynurenine 3-monooxygenase n=1 Tax=Paraglomus brasilianum TaxID=144538 RepID=A0A9N9GWL7_9GLOM|nr:4960_t:CDS:2 [Paraglomus brasilianum]
MTETVVRRVAIVGGGLVGMLAAIYFANRGWQVTVFEFRKDSRQLEDTALLSNRSINLALSVRGLNALKKPGLGLHEQVLGSVIPMKGRMLHLDKGRLVSHPYGVFGECINSIDRAQLLKLLLDTAEELANVKILFEHQLKYCDFDSGVLVFENHSNGSEVSQTTDLIIGADGAYSTVRSQLMRPVRMNFQQEYIPHAYCELNIPPVTDADGRSKFAMDPNHLHIWPRHSFMMIALPNTNKSFTCTLFMPFEEFEAIKTENDLMSFFQKHFPDSIPLMGAQNLKEEYFRNPKGPMMSIKCTPYNYKERAIIIGDAAHCMVPFYGQGMNCGFEDVFLLNDFLDKFNVDDTKDTNEFRESLDRALNAYTERRHTDAAAICDLAMRNYIEMRSDVVKPLYIIRKRIEGALHAIFPKHFIPLYTMVSFSNIRYSEAVYRWKRQGLWLSIAAAAGDGS